MSHPSETVTIAFIHKFLTLPDRKPLWTIIWEYFYLGFVYGTNPKHYFTRYLFKKGITNIRDYIPNKILGHVRPYFNEKSVVEIQESKLLFNLYYGQFDIPIPNTIMYNHHRMFIVGKKVLQIISPADFQQLLTDVFQKNSLNSIFIKGSYWTWGGNQVYKLYDYQLIDDRAKIDAMYEVVIKSGYVFQETIQQHPEMDRLNPSCVNTIRMDTFIDKDGNIEIISGYMRTSIRNLHVDNGAQGGGVAIVNLDTGKLCSGCYLGFTHDLGEPLKEHPVTHVVFEGFQIPYFKEAKELIIQAASVMSGLRLIGWDIGISATGPVLIEGNPDYAMEGCDFAAGGYLSKPVFRKVWNEFHAKNRSNQV